MTQEQRDVKKLTDLLLSYMANGKVPHYVILSRKRLLSPRFRFFEVLNRDLFINRDDSFTNKMVIILTEQPPIFLYHFRN